MQRLLLLVQTAEVPLAEMDTLPPSMLASSNGARIPNKCSMAPPEQHPRIACIHDQVELGHTMCRAFLDRDLARKLKTSVEEITEARQRQELANKHL